MATATPITRVTMLEIPGEAHQAIALQGFEVFTKTQQKDGVPYILSMQAGRVSGSVLEQGFTIVAKSIFATEEDMEFYETQCLGHLEYKKFLKANAPVEGLMSVIFTPEVGF